MFDTLAVARALTDADLTPAQAEAIANAVRQAAEHGEHGEHVSPDQFRAGLAELRADLTWRMLAVGGLIVAVLRLLDWSA